MTPMDEYLEKNKELWNELTSIHAGSEFYDLENFKRGKCSLNTIELEEMGDVSDKSLLHLQCHFGMDTLSWARLGAKVTGVDFSDKAIALARSLSEELGIKADFICCNIYDLPQNLDGQFDIVFTSYGVLCWLPDLERWAEVITVFLKPGGTFYIVNGHPFCLVFDDSAGTTELKASHTYFPNPEPVKFEKTGDYAVSSTLLDNPSYEWTHSLGEIITALATAGLRIEYLHEFPVCCYQALPFMERDEKEWWRLPGDKIPLLFSIKATKPKG